MKKEELDNVIIETVEVFINQILYLRKAYPQQIFKKRRKYNAPVYASIFPPLNAYLHNVLRSAKELLSVGELQRIEIIFYVDEEDIMERHILELDVISSSKTESGANDEFLLDFEENLRKSLYQMSEHMKILRKLSNEAKMKINLHTTQNGHIRLNANAHLQAFPWLQTNKHVNATETLKQLYLLPLTTVPELGINLLTEVG